MEDIKQQQESPMLYKDMADVKPIYNSAEENAVIRIQTSEEFDDAFAYLRALMNTNEMSERALQLTQTCISHNAANYSVWHYRREILRFLKKSVSEELLFTDEIINDNPKNYQVWHHRKTLVEESKKYEAELEFIRIQIGQEPKNYHAWQYRQWVVEKFGLYSKEEMNFSTELILQDVRNNSAWNYRYFIGITLGDCFKDQDFLQKEIEFTLNCIKKAPSNESAWSYLSGILINDSLGPDRSEIVRCCEELQSRDPPVQSPHLHLFLVDSLVDKIEKCEDDDAKKKEYLAKADEYVTILQKIDPIRRNFWDYKRNFFQNLVDLSISIK